jgi:hypothetical protein
VHGAVEAHLQHDLLPHSRQLLDRLVNHRLCSANLTSGLVDTWLSRPLLLRQLHGSCLASWGQRWHVCRLQQLWRLQRLQQLRRLCSTLRQAPRCGTLGLQRSSLQLQRHGLPQLTKRAR